MPLPAGIGATILRGSLLGAGGIAAGATAGAVLQPTTRWATYRANANLQGLIPDIGNLISLYHQGELTAPQWFDWAKNLGVDDGSLPNSTAFNLIWRILLENSGPVPSIEDARILLVRGQITQQEFEAILQRHGFAQFGIRWPWVDYPNPLPTAMLLDAVNRGFLSLADLDQQLRALGYGDERDRRALGQLRFWIPGPADLISFSVREVWQPEIVERFEYDLEFPPSFQDWMNRQGAGWKPSDLYPGTPPEQDIPWPLAFWRAHWRVISPTEAIEALHRLRPVGFLGNRSRIEGVRPFTRQDFDLILKVADFPPIMREWLYGLSFRPLTRIDLRRAFRIGVIDREQVLEGYRDLGYDERNAAILADFTAEEQSRAKISRSIARAQTAIRESLRLGVLSIRQAAVQLRDLEPFTQAERQQWSQAPIGLKEEIALAHPAVKIVLAEVQTKLNIDRAKAVLKGVRSVFMRGEIDAQDAIGMLTALGITPDNARGRIELWQLERLTRGKEATTAQLIKWYTRGAIPAAETFARLINLGWGPRDANVLIGLATEDIALAQARLAEKAAQSAQQLQKALEDQAKALEREREKVLTRLKRQASEADIKRWFAERVIPYHEALRLLLERGNELRFAKAKLQEAATPTPTREELRELREEISQGQETGPDGNGTGDGDGSDGGAET